MAVNKNIRQIADTEANLKTNSTANKLMIKTDGNKEMLHTDSTNSTIMYSPVYKVYNKGTLATTYPDVTFGITVFQDQVVVNEYITRIQSDYSDSIRLRSDEIDVLVEGATVGKFTLANTTLGGSSYSQSIHGTSFKVNVAGVEQLEINNTSTTIKPANTQVAQFKTSSVTVSTSMSVGATTENSNIFYVEGKGTSFNKRLHEDVYAFSLTPSGTYTATYDLAGDSSGKMTTDLSCVFATDGAYFERKNVLYTLASNVLTSVTIDETEKTLTGSTNSITASLAAVGSANRITLTLTNGSALNVSGTVRTEFLFTVDNLNAKLI